jgi:hypothetical protein
LQEDLMLARFALGIALLSATSVNAVSRSRIYVITAGKRAQQAENELNARVRSQMRTELERRGAFVADVMEYIDGTLPSAIVLRPSVEILPSALQLNVIGTRAGDQKLLGTISAKASGSNRDAQVKALVSRACAEAEQL